MNTNPSRHACHRRPRSHGRRVAVALPIPGEPLPWPNPDGPRQEYIVPNPVTVGTVEVEQAQARIDEALLLAALHRAGRGKVLHWHDVDHLERLAHNWNDSVRMVLAARLLELVSDLTDAPLALVSWGQRGDRDAQ